MAHLFHVHVCAAGHADIEATLAFRDYLRAHRADAQAYAQLKTRLAAEYAYDNLVHMQGKDRFVKDLLARSLATRAAAIRQNPEPPEGR